MKKQLITLGFVAAIALTGCGNGQSISNSAGSGTSAENVQNNVENWVAQTKSGASLTISADIDGPADATFARALIKGSADDLNYLAVTIDNRDGKEAYPLPRVNFTDPDGNNVEYRSIGDFLNLESEKPEGLSSDETRFIENVAKRFNEEEYTVAKGEKITLYLASNKPYFTQIVQAYIGDINLEASTQGADLSIAAEPLEIPDFSGSNNASADGSSAEPTGNTQVNDIADKTIFRGTTMKGNDITFIILSPAQQQELHNAGGLGSWGLLCSVKALPEQLNETGVNSTEAGGAVHTWRSLAYTSTEVGYSPETHDSVANRISAFADQEASGSNCVGVNAGDANAATKSYGTVTVGQYFGTSALDNPVQAR